MQRYFAEVKNNKVFLNNDDEHHVLHVMRNKIDDLIEVVSDSTLFLAKIISLKPLEIEVVEKKESNVITKDITLFFALAKGEKIDFVIQKGTELGAKNIVLVKTKRCVVKMDEEDFKKKLVRYNKIAKEASEQSLRLDIPSILGVYDLKNIPRELLKGNLFVAYEKEKGNTGDFYSLLAENKENPIGIMVGPEGGFEETEIEYLNKIGFKNVSLGNRILRTETAAVYALSVISFLMER